MDDTGISREVLEQYRTSYLKLRSVLYDRVTTLPTLAVCIDDLRTMLDQRRGLGVLHLEIEDLSMVESIYGWQVFDTVLRRVASVLGAAVGTLLPEGSQVVLDRVAGDRFITLVPCRSDGSEVDGRYLGQTGERLRKRVTEAFSGEEFAGLSPKLGFRVGHAVLSQNPFSRFERQIYAAVDEARAFDRLRERRRERSWSEALKKIIADAGVGTVFQPVVDLGTREVVGYEAFARGPKNSPLEMPQAMFAISDRIGEATRLDRICREAALRASAEMVRRGKIFLNVLPGGADEGEWQEGELLSLLEAADLAPADLVLEFSERAVDEDPDAFIAVLGRLKARGFCVAIDDVGTGYSGQSILESVKPDYLKLDVSLVRGIQDNLIKQELLHSVVGIAERIDARVIAEGVETEAEAATLAEAGAALAQGYLFGKPVAATEVAASPRRRRDH